MPLDYHLMNGILLVLYALNAFYYTKNFFILLFFRLFNNETTPTHIMAIYPITVIEHSS